MYEGLFTNGESGGSVVDQQKKKLKEYESLEKTTKNFENK